MSSSAVVELAARGANGRAEHVGAVLLWIVVAAAAIGVIALAGFAASSVGQWLGNGQRGLATIGVGIGVAVLGYIVGSSALTGIGIATIVLVVIFIVIAGS